MVEPRRPTAEELDGLIEAFRRDPGRGFVALGAAYLSLGRPRDAVEAGAMGLKADPNNLEGRVLVAHAFAQLHQWKEAQAELLKVVKTDRNHGFGFRLLGEVLMRRGDYERALPVLQHAQNLAPADPTVLALLKRARSGTPLDPPPPPPTPIAPAGGGGRARPAPASRQVFDDGSFPDDAATRVAGEAADFDGVLGRVDLERREVRHEGGRAPVDRGTRRADDRGMDREDRRPVEVHRPPPIEDPLAPLGADPRLAAAQMPTQMAAPLGGPGRPGQPPVSPFAQTMLPPGMAPQGMAPQGMAPQGMAPQGMAGPGPGMMPVRPRVMPLEKPKDAAQGALRQSAAVGEDYLNNLLAGGLLDVPRVRVADAHYDIRPDRRWGRSTARMFIYLFVLLFLGLGGAGTWYWYAEQQRAEDVARFIATATTDVELGDHASLVAADTAARAAIERDRDNAYAIAVLAQITSLETLLYDELQPSDVEKAVTLAAEQITAPTDQGYRELVVARGALALASLSPEEEGSERRLADVQKELAAWLEGHPEDHLVRWLQGETLMAAGARAAAETAFEQAHAAGKGAVLGTIALASARLDDGRYDEARALFDAALARAPKHPWAFLGRSMVRSERSLELEEAMGDLNVGIAQAAGPRVAAYKRLALAIALHGLEDHAAFGKELDQATGVEEPRFLARLGLLRVAQGRIADAAAARAKIRWYADKPEADPLVSLLDAELMLARGLPAASLELVGKQEGLRAARLRGRAHYDRGAAAEAAKELGDALEIAPEDLEARTWAEAARLVASTGEERRKADDALDSLGRKARSKIARLAHGLALAAVGRAEDARTRLEQSLDGVSEEEPNPLAYRAHVALGELDLAAGKPDDATTHARQALELNPGYLPAHDLLGRVLLASAPDQARTHLTEVVSAEAASAAGEIAFARLTVATDAAAAADALARAQAKGATVEDLQAVYAEFPPELMAKLGVAAPKK